MFNIFRRVKPRLFEVILPDFVDIHSHILPGVDDGAKNIKESVSLITEINKLGFKKVIGTPHTYPGLYNNDRKSIKESFKKIIGLGNKTLNVDYASEYLIDTIIIKMAEKKTLLTLKDNYVLVEMSYLNFPNNLFEIIFELRINNYIPILAHPERYLFWYNDFSKLEKLRAMDCKFQLNMLSMTGYYGDDVVRMADKLLEKGFINFLGSDIHNLRHTDKFNDRIKIKTHLDTLIKIMKNNNIFL